MKSRRKEKLGIYSPDEFLSSSGSVTPHPQLQGSWPGSGIVSSLWPSRPSVGGSYCCESGCFSVLLGLFSYPDLQFCARSPYEVLFT